MKNIFLLLLTVVLFSTVNGQTTLNEGFETWPATGWEIFLEGDSTRGWRQDFENISHTGSHSADSNIANNQMDNWLVSPAINVVNANYELKYWEISSANDIEFYDRSSVHVSTGSSNPADGNYVEVYEANTLNTVNWEERTIDLSAYDGQTIYVAFRHEGTYHKWFVDDVTVGPPNFVDAALLGFSSPVGISETPVISPVIVELQNFGSTVINDFTISWEVNSVAQPVYNGSGLALQPGQSATITIGNYNFNSEGSFQILANVDLFNDFDSSNDEINTTYEISSFKDGAIVSVSPDGMIPSPTSLDVLVEVVNLGQNTIEAIEIIWSINGIDQTPFTTGNLNLVSGETTTVNLGQYAFTSGLNDLVVTLNILGDVDTSNNQYERVVPVDTFWESFEGANFPPEGWSINFGVRDDINFDEPVEGNYYYASQPATGFFGTVADSLYTPLLDIADGDRFTFYIKSSVAQATQNTLVWKDGTTGEVNVIADIPNSPGFNQWELRDIDISAAAGINQIGIVTTAETGGLTKFDLFTSDAKLYQFDNDLKVVNGDMYFIAKQNISEGFTCTIKNAGQMAVSGSAYTVKLMQAPNIELASVSGVDLASLQETGITVNHTFTTLSENRLFFEIEYANDEYLVNNTFREANVSVVPNTVNISAIGILEDQLFVPFTPGGSSQTLGEDDISEAMYYSDEFNSAGYAYGVAYKYNNISNADKVTNYPLKVWVTQTNLDNLSGGWTPNEDLVLVFDGVVEILPGDNHDLYIPFDEPVLINGIENVVVRSYQYDPEWPPSILRFLGNNANVGPIRTIGALEVFDLDPDNPPNNFFQDQSFNYAQFVVDPVTTTTTLSGVVYDNSTNNPIENASITIEGSTISALTDVNGNYTLPALPYGNYDITASFTLFQDNTISIELNSSNQTQDFYLDQLNEVEIVGTIYGSNAISTPLELVNVSLVQDGTIIETVTTNANGDFIFPIVFGGSDYEINMFMYGYNEQIISISPVAANIDLSDIILDEEFISPFDVQVDDSDGPTVSWKSPKLSSKVKLQYDFNEESNGYSNEPNEEVWLGNYYVVSELTTITSVEIQTSIYQGVEDFVTVDIIDLVTNEVLASSEPFLILQNATQVIDIPNIVVDNQFMAGVHWQNNVETTNFLSVDYSDPNIFDGAVIRYPGQFPTFLSNLIGVQSSFLLRVNTLDDGTPITNNETITYNVYRGLASEFPDTSNWDLLNSSPINELTYIDTNSTNIDPNEFYRYAIETIYNQGVSEVTFSNAVLGGVLNIEEFEELSSRISIFPNPAKEDLSIALDSNLNIETDIKIYDVSGKLVKTISSSIFENNNAKVNVESLQSGMYFVKLSVNEVTVTKKFYKE
ncbi:choice-of-anchor J domain-containing protein [Winogradskyella sp.]|nr:choice-of-anchor J domain-containing protein [Winogradskyella sp.]